MIDSINKNTEVVGVSDALKQLATKKTSPLQKQTQIDDCTITDNKITINPSSSSDDFGLSQTDDCEKAAEATQTCGWFSYRPKWLRRFMNPHYALAFLCLAGAIQGN